MKKIIFICPYFGKYPNYFNLTLNSIKYNDTIDWLIITDIKEKYDYPQNVKVINMTFNELREKVQSVFDFKINLDKPFKICDFRPAYGLIFREYLYNYDFWGHCDFDCIYGNLRKFLSETVLENNDRIYYLGAMSLYKNNEVINNVFKKKIDDLTNYKKIFSDKESYSFDELGSVRILNYYGYKIYYNYVFADIYTWSKPLKNIQTTVNFTLKKHEFKLDKIKKQIFEFNKGILKGYYLIGLYNKIYEEEYMYIHLQRRFMDNNVANIHKFLIIPNKFIDFVDNIDKKFIMQHSKENIFYKRYLKTRRSWNKRKNKLKIMFKLK